MSLDDEDETTPLEQAQDAEPGGYSIPPAEAESPDDAADEE
jgi:hypothetical protein